MKSHAKKWMRMGRRLICLTLFVLLGLISASSVPAAQPTTKPNQPVDRIPDALIDPGSGRSPYLLVVEKKHQRMYVYEFKQGRYYLDRLLPCSTGENTGDKTREGDKKTPEGFYIFNKKSLKHELADIYGILAYPMDYPNFWDVRLGKKGDGIWMHGINKPLKPLDSNGCVELRNIDIMELEEHVGLYDTPIIIYDEIAYKDVDTVNRESARIKEFVESWRRAWVGKDFPGYIAKYSKNFTSNDGKDYEGWADHKRRLSEQYKKIEVELRSMRIFRHQGMIVVMFEQYYRGDGFKSDGAKQLYLREKGGDDYEIEAEVWSEFPPKSNPRMLSAEVKREVVEAHREAMAKLGPEPKPVSQPEPVMAAKAQPKAGRPPDSAPVRVAQAPGASAPEATPINDSDAELEKIFVNDDEPIVAPVRTAQADSPPASGEDAGKNKKPKPQSVPASDEPVPSPKNEPLPKPAPPEPALDEIESAEAGDGPVDPETAAVKQTVDEWLAAWRARDIDRYIRHYHTDFRYKDMDREKYREFKTSLAGKYNGIVIDVQKLEIAVDGGEARVTFIQDYRSDQYSDYGLKTLVMQKQDGGWRIKRENWQDLSGAGAKP